MGTPDFAVNSLKELLDNNHDVAAVVTQPDKPVGRKQILTPPPIKQFALSNNIKVIQPNSLKDDEIFQLLKEINADVFVVVAYGKLLPKKILELPKYGCVNVHASLLPKYRGASPIQWSIVCGENKTGVCTMLLDEGMDTGDILLSESIIIENNDTAETLSSKLSMSGAKLLIKTLEGLQSGTITPIKQDDLCSCYAPIIKKSDGAIDWSKSAMEINCLIKGLQSWPTAYTILKGKRLKVFKAEVLDLVLDSGKPGKIVVDNNQLIVQCGKNSALKILDLQLEGSKRMSIQDFIRGRDLTSCYLG